MQIDKHSVEEDYPLSGGGEANFKFGKGAIIGLIIFVIMVAIIALKIKGII